ncbi:hypothetical protein D3C77_382190 [compost metagenome]
MIIDKEKLKALAEIMLRDVDGCLTDSEARDFQQHVADYEALTQPGGVLALLEEIEQLRESHEQVCANYNRVSFASEERGNQVDQLKAENEALRKDAERYRFVRNPIGTSSPLAIWNEGKMPLFSGMADAVVDEFMAKEASHG